MGLGPLVKSVLKETVEQLPEDFAIKSASAENYLLKQGVKPEELKFAKLGLPADKVTKADLVKAEQMRGGTIGSREAGNEYSYVTLRGEEDNPSYKEVVYTFNPMQQEQKKSIAAGEPMPMSDGYRSGHYNIPNYLMHARTIDKDIGDGANTRVILEIQSDLHQEGRQSGYRSTFTEEQLAKAEDVGFATGAGDLADKEAADLAVSMGWQHTGQDANAVDWLTNLRYSAPEAPLEKNWLRKGMEYELVRALAEGSDQVAIPLTGQMIESLSRGEGVQKWYETTVKQTAEKLAKATGGTAEVVSQRSKSGSAKYIVETSTAAGNGAKTRLARLGSPEESGDPLNVLRSAVSAYNKVDLPGEWSNEAELPLALFNRLSKIDTEFKKDIDKLYNEARLGYSKPEDTAELMQKRYNKAMEEAKPHIDSIDAATSRKEGDYVVIKPGPKRDFTLYSSGAAGAFVVAGAIQDGFSEEEIAGILKEQGYADDEVQTALSNGRKAAEAKAEGFTDAEIEEVLNEKDPSPSSVEERQPAMQSWQGRDTAAMQTPGTGYEATMNPASWPTAEESRAAAYKRLTEKGTTTAQQLVTDLKVIQPAMVSLTERAQGMMGNQLKQRQVEVAEREAQQKIVNLASERGINVQVQGGEYFAQTEDGKWAKVTPDLLDELASAKGEIVGGTAGAIAGGMMPIPHPLAKFLGSAAGAALGAAAGTQLDYLYSAMKVSEDMNAQVALNKALTAAELSIVGDSIAYPIAKLGGAAVRGIKRAKDLIVDGNSAGAYQALKDTMFISDGEAQQIVEGLQKFAAVPGGNPAEQRIASTILTRPGGEAIVQSVVRDSPKASQAIVQALDSRAQDIMRTSSELSGEGVAKLLREDLDNYVADVKGFYGSVKDRALKAPGADQVQFDYDGLAVEPVLKRLQANIQDPTVLQRFVAQAERIRETSDSRSFGDLLELRHLVNDFKFNKRITSAKDYDALNEVLTRIDGAVKQSAELVLPDSKQWLTDWASARAKYAQMMRTQENVLVKALRSSNITEAEVGNRLVKHIQTVDGTLEEVLSKLPANARKRAEGAVIKTLVDKTTAGAEGGLRATDFPTLAKELDKITFTTKEPRQLKLAVNKMAEVFRNDLALAKASGRVYFQRPGGFLADDLASKFKYQAAQNIFQNVQKMLPTEHGRGIALIAKAADLLENPLHAKTAKELMEDYADVANIPDMIKRLQIDAAREAAEGKTSANVNLYGDGKVLSTKGSGAKQQIPLHRIATADQVKEISETYGIAPSNTRELEAILKDRGFKGVMQGSDKVRKL